MSPPQCLDDPTVKEGRTVFWMVLLDLFLANALLLTPGLDRPVADAYYPCATPEICDCPADSPCKKDCCKDACTCKANRATAACTQAACPAPGAPVCVPMPPMPAAMPTPAVP